MSGNQENPYASPQVESLGQSDAGSGSENALHGLKPRSVILMILLIVVTLGLYVNYWVYVTARVLNQKLDRNRISMPLVGLFWALSLASVFWTIPEIITEDDEAIVRIGRLITNVDAIVTIVFAFTIRGGLNALTRVPPAHAGWFHGLWTFLFGIVYLQWKINKDLRLPRLPPRKPDSAVAQTLQFLDNTKERAT